MTLWGTDTQFRLPTCEFSSSYAVGRFSLLGPSRIRLRLRSTLSRSVGTDRHTHRLTQERDQALGRCADLERRLEEAHDDLAAGRATLRRMIRAENSAQDHAA